MKILIGYFLEYDKLTLKLICKSKKKKLANTIFEEKEQVSKYQDLF